MYSCLIIELNYNLSCTKNIKVKLKKNREAFVTYKSCDIIYQL